LVQEIFLRNNELGPNKKRRNAKVMQKKNQMISWQLALVAFVCHTNQSGKEGRFMHSTIRPPSNKRSTAEPVILFHGCRHLD
jgi:hypothetical protein